MYSEQLLPVYCTSYPIIANYKIIQFFQCNDFCLYKLVSQFVQANYRLSLLAHHCNTFFGPIQCNANCLEQLQLSQSIQCTVKWNLNQPSK